ncbi:MAG: hypothetical protein WC611_00670 [Candidatus Neomarinimicrobiota bacterium]
MLYHINYKLGGCFAWKFFIISCFFILTYFASGQDIDKYKNVNWRIYHQLNFTDYIDVNSDEWKNISQMCKKELLQIPKSELKQMSTRELIEAYINCAFTRSFFLYSEVDEYYKQLGRGFNGVNELINRTDVTNEVINYYVSLDPKSNSVSTSGIEAPCQIQFLEYLIGNPGLVERFDLEQLRLVISELIKKYEIKKGAIQHIYIDSIGSNIYAISKLLCRSETGKQKELFILEGINTLYQTGRLPNDKIDSQIINLANDFIGN